MAFFFKKKIKARKFAAVLGHLALAQDRTEQFLSAISSAVEINSEEDKNRIAGAIVLLQLFASINAVTTILGRDSPESKAVLEHFFSDLEKLDQETTEGATFSDTVRPVFSTFTTALKTPHEQGPFFNIGKEFAKLCGKEYDPFLMQFGANHYTYTVDMIREMLMKTPIKL